MTENLTKARVEKFVSAGPPPGKSEAILWDGVIVGLGVRGRAPGSASWVFQYRRKAAGRGEPARKVTLGSWPTLTIDAARTAAQAMAGEIALNKDPARDLRAERTRNRQIVSAALDSYERALERRKIVNAKTVMSTLRRGFAPFMNREVDALTRANIVGLIEELENAGKPGAAIDLRSHSRAWLEWAVSRGLAPFNVLAGLRRPRSSRAERLGEESKGKALPDAEIVALWKATATLGHFGGLVRLALLTGMRRNELSGLRWSDVHDDRIVLAAQTTKTGAKHEIPVTALMRNVLAAQPRTTSDLVFPSSRTGIQMRGWTSRVNAAVSASGVTFTLHDLRRTTRTLLSRCGVPQDVAELAIGHVRSGLLAIYNKDTAWRARTDAFERVSQHVAQLVSGGAPETGEAGEKRVVALGARR
jgi:integrase